MAVLLDSGVGADRTLLHVVDTPEEAEEGQAFMKDWMVENGPDVAELVVDDSGDIEGAIEGKPRNAPW